MMVLYGRRRVGKSTLIKEFIKGRRAIYYTASKTGIRNNLEKLGRQVLAELAPELEALVFHDMDTLFSFVGKRCMDERIVVVIDELPYLVEADSGVLSVIQNHIDGEWASGQMFLILCGSSISFMENEVLSEKSPCVWETDSADSAGTIFLYGSGGVCTVLFGGGQGGLLWNYRRYRKIPVAYGRFAEP